MTSQGVSTSHPYNWPPTPTSSLQTRRANLRMKLYQVRFGITRGEKEYERNHEKFHVLGGKLQTASSPREEAQIRSAMEDFSETMGESLEWVQPKFDERNALKEELLECERMIRASERAAEAEKQKARKGAANVEAKEDGEDGGEKAEGVSGNLARKKAEKEAARS